MAIEKTINISVNSDDAVKGLDKIDDSVKEIDNSTLDLTSSLDKMSGGMISGFKNLVGGVRSGIVAMKSLKVAIAATGVGLLVLAFGALVTFFTKSQKGMDLLSVAMAQFGAAVDVIIDRVIAVGEVLSNIFSKPFSETVDGVSESFKGMGDEMERDIRLAKELELATQKLRKTEIDQIVTQALRRKDIAKLRNESKDQLLSIDQRIDKLKEAQRLEQENLNEQLANQATRVAIAARENARANSTDEDNKKLELEKARLIDLQTESYSRQRTVISELESLKNQGRTEDGDGEVIQTRQPVELLQTQYNDELLVIKDGEEAKTKLLLDEITKRNEQAEALNKANLDKEVLLNQMANDAKVGIAYNTFSLIGAIAEEGSALAKTAAVAQATISGFQGVQNAFTTASASPITTVFPAYPFIQAGLAGAFSAVQIGKILSSKSDGSGEKPSANVSGGGGVTAPSFNLVEGTGTSQISSDIASQNTQPVQAFVVSGDVTSQQSLDRNANTNASF